MSCYLAERLGGVGIELPKPQLASIDAFLDLLERWNSAFNLTAVKTRREMVDRHIVDSLTIAPFISGGSVIDVGTGAGLPGIPLAITNPVTQFTMLDTNGKKTRFVQQAIAELGLANCEVVQARSENYDDRTFDHVVCRAFAGLDALPGLTAHLLAGNGTLLAMKGEGDEAESFKSDAMTIDAIHDLPTVGDVKARCLVVLSKINKKNGA